MDVDAQALQQFAQCAQVDRDARIITLRLHDATPSCSGGSRGSAIARAAAP